MSSQEKVLGQFFSGARVSDLLARLAHNIQPNGIESVIDPMAGQGDLLYASCKLIPNLESICGIEIDEITGANCALRVPSARVVISDAFSESARDTLCAREWDLVIANPPYVRRELIESVMTENRSSDSIRSLLKATLPFVTNGDSAPFIKACSSYPNTSDLAIPAWILCASIVRQGGTLAIVVPEAWLKSDYAASIRKMLHDSFSIEYIVEDVSRKWFEPAQIKTNLVVARKCVADKNHNYCKISLESSLSTEDSLVGNLSYNGFHGFAALAEAINQHVAIKLPGATVSWQKQSDLSSPMSFFGRIEGLCESDGYANLDSSLEDWGIACGQGFRSGANQFFYFEKTDDGVFENDLTRIWLPEKCLGAEYSGLFKNALSRQSQLGNSFLYDMANSSDVVLFVDESTIHQLREGDRDYSLRDYILKAEQEEILIKGSLRKIPELSAVRTNGGTLSSQGLVSEKYWFVLPPTKPRHSPAVCIPRIVGAKSIATRITSETSYVVDANFTTFWPIADLDPRVILALLNSSFVSAFLEENGTVMGGGALKCEASLFKKLRLPRPNEELIGSLRELGAQLEEVDTSNSKIVIEKIDARILEAAFPSCDINVALRGLARNCETKLLGRKKK